jgi:hypothetical protein
MDAAARARYASDGHHFPSWCLLTLAPPRAGLFRARPWEPHSRIVSGFMKWRSKLHRRRSRAGAKLAAGGATSKAMTTLADMNHLWPADHNATPWVATRDGSWTRMVGNGVNLNIPRPQKEGRPERAGGPVEERPPLAVLAAGPVDPAPTAPSSARTLLRAIPERRVLARAPRRGGNGL